VLTKIQKEFGVEVVAINIVPKIYSLEDWQAFLKEFGAGNFVWAQDTDDGRAVQAYNIQALGVTVIVGRDGRVAYRDDTTSTHEMLREGVLQALK